MSRRKTKTEHKGDACTLTLEREMEKFEYNKNHCMDDNFSIDLPSIQYVMEGVIRDFFCFFYNKI